MRSLILLFAVTLVLIAACGGEDPPALTSTLVPATPEAEAARRPRLPQRQLTATILQDVEVTVGTLRDSYKLGILPRGVIMPAYGFDAIAVQERKEPMVALLGLGWTPYDPAK